MSMTNKTSVIGVSADDDQIVRRFVRGLRSNPPRGLSDVLPELGTLPAHLLARLAGIELRDRLVAGEAARVEEYLTRFPPLADDDAAVLDLIATELCHRHDRSPADSRAELAHRFPWFAERIRGLDPATLAPPEGDVPTPHNGAPGSRAHPTAGGDDRTDGAESEGSNPVRTVRADIRPVAAQESRVPGVRPAGARPHSVGPYEVLGELGRGGMGVVYKARHRQLDRVVALKMVLAGAEASPTDRERFRSEARAVARLDHPNIVRIFEVGEFEGQPYFVLEFLPGGGLDRKLRDGRVTPVEAAGYVETLARAVHAAHAAGLVHRDLKPGNVLFAADGAPKVTDFGLVKQLDRGRGQTRTGATLGTPAYMAPEQALGQPERISPATDVYALGAILYEAVAGRPPFLGETAVDTMIKVIHEYPAAPTRIRPNLPRDLETICLKCLHKEPERRYRTAADLAEDLRRFRHHEPIAARPVSWPEHGWWWVRRHWRTLLPAAAVLLAVLVVGGMAVARVRDGWQKRQELTARVGDLVAKTDGAIAAGAWDDARLHLSHAAAAAADVAATFPEEEAAATALVGERQATIAARAAARDRFETFVRGRDEALFQAALAFGRASRAGLRARRDHVLSLLRPVGLDPFADADWVPPAEFTAGERAELLAGGYDLLLTLADILVSEASPAEGGPPPASTVAAVREAVAVLDRAGRLGGRGTGLLLRRARYHALAGDADAAGRDRAAAAATSPVTATDFFRLGEEHYRGGDLDRALAALRQALDLSPGHFWANYHLALCRMARDEPGLARAYLDVCVGSRRDVVWVYLLRGFALGLLKEYPAAEADFDRAAALLRKTPDPEADYVRLNNRAVVRLGAGRPGEAADDLAEAVRLDPTRYEAYLSLAQTAIAMRHKSQALDHLTRAAVAAEPVVRRGDLAPSTLAMLYWLRARLSDELGRTTEAIADLDRVTALEPPGSAGRGRGFRDRGIILARAERFDEALRAFEDAVSVTPDDPEAHGLRAETLIRLRRYDEVPAAVDAYFSRGGKPRPELYQVRGAARSKLGDHQAAVADFTLALDARPGNPALLCSRGWAYLGCQAYKPAAADFEKAVKVDPACAEGFAGRGLVRVLLGRTDLGLADAEHAVRTGAPTAAVYYACARAFGEAARGDPTSPKTSETRRAAARYRDRGTELLNKSLERLPVAERAAFWRDVVARDSAVRPLRPCPEFARLEERYARPETGR